jgi:hypothetical protein
VYGPPLTVGCRFSLVRQRCASQVDDDEFTIGLILNRLPSCPAAARNWFGPPLAAYGELVEDTPFGRYRLVV